MPLHNAEAGLNYFIINSKQLKYRTLRTLYRYKRTTRYKRNNVIRAVPYAGGRREGGRGWGWGGGGGGIEKQEITFDCPPLPMDGQALG